LRGFFGVFFGSAAGNSVDSVAATVGGAAAVDATPVSVESGAVAATAGGVAGFGAAPDDGSDRAVSVRAGAGAVAATGAGAAGFDAAFDGVSERAASVEVAGLVTTMGGGDFGAARDACERVVSLDFAAAAGVDDFVATLEGWSARTAGANAEPCTTAGGW
jgi:hypothetical protein